MKTTIHSPSEELQQPFHDSQKTASVLCESNIKELLEKTKQERVAAENTVEELERKVQALEQMKTKIAQLKAFEDHLSLLSQGKIAMTVEAEPEKKHATLQQRKRAYSYNERVLPEDSDGSFFPDKAYECADAILAHRQSVNYEIFRAIVLGGGQADTRMIKDYLIEQNITTRAGKTFEDCSLSEISARASYLVKRGVLRPIGPGRFQSCFGWG